MSTNGHDDGRGVSRISLSLPEELLVDLDRMVGARGFASRSHAVNDMLHQFVVEHKREMGDGVMVGTITLFYDNSVHGLQKHLADMQFGHIDEVISSLHVHLVHNQTMEVILVQGPAKKLQEIANEMITRRGVISGRMQLIAALMPPVHPLPKRRAASLARAPRPRDKVSATLRAARVENAKPK
jgi:CopG family transcriptional regulator, nickel-responsive regulator